MKLQKPSVKSLQPILAFFRRYRFILFVGFFAGIYMYLLCSINQLTSSAPPQADIDNAQSTVKRLRVDEEAVEKMLTLEEENIEVQALFEDARNNPFGE